MSAVYKNPRNYNTSTKDNKDNILRVQSKARRQSTAALLLRASLYGKVCENHRIDRKDSPASFAVSTPQKNVGRSVAKPSSESPSPESQVNTFIDIGSGYGKVVFHAKLGGRYSHSVGIEYVESRASLAASIRDERLLERNNLLNSSARELLRSCVLVHADATKWKCFNYSHIYMYFIYFFYLYTSS